MTTFSIIYAPSAGTSKLVDRLARQGSNVRIATESDAAAALLATPTDVLVLTAGSTFGDSDWTVGTKTSPSLSRVDLPAKIDASVVLIDIPDGGDIEADVRARLPQGAVTLRSAHTTSRREFFEDSAQLLVEFVTGAYDKYKPDTEDLARVWVEAEDAAIKAAGGALTRRREPLRYLRTLVG